MLPRFVFLNSELLRERLLGEKQPGEKQLGGALSTTPNDTPRRGAEGVVKPQHMGKRRAMGDIASVPTA